MTDYTGRLRLALQALDENEDTWGTVLNAGVFQLLEDAVSGTVSVSLAAGNATLTANDGATDTSRYMILNINGTLTANRQVIVPEGTDGGGAAAVVARTKLYLCANNTSGAFTVTVKTSSGSGVVIPQGAAVWVYSDGTDVLPTHALTADSATSADGATDADTLDGVAASAYALLAGTSPFTRAQKTTRVALTSATSISLNASLSNAYSLTLVHNATLGAPSSPVDGQTLRIAIKQGAGGPYTLAYNSVWTFPGGSVPSLTATVGAVDYLCAEYYSGDSIWLAGLSKGFDN